MLTQKGIHSMDGVFNNGRGRLNLLLPSLGLVAMALASSGCATGAPKTDGGAVGQIIREASGSAEYPAQFKPGTYKAESKVVSRGDLEVWGHKLKNDKFDYPVIVNPAVEYWLTYFTGKGRKYFDKYLARGRYFIPTISKVLKAHNMPQDLVYLAMIESGFNNTARSHARAVGPWQFIRPTGVRYGLTVNYWLDERRDTRKSTLAAIAYLKELYEEFGSWELAAAGYNAGENKVRRAIAKYRTTNFWEISRHKFFRRETRDYVPKIMAAAIIAKNPEQFGFANPFDSSKGQINPTVLAHLSDDEKAEFESEEPTPKELGEPVAKNDDSTEDPADKADDKGEEVAEEDDAQDDAAMISSTPHPTMTPSLYMVANPNEQIIEFEIKGPADLFAISKASGLPYSTIKLLNPELLRWCTPPTMKSYRIKLPLSVKDRFLATYNDESFDRRVVFMRYTVKRGDSVQKISRRFKIDGNPIREINHFTTRVGSLRAGSEISLPIPTGYKRVIASMYDEKPMKARRKRSRRIRRVRHSKHSSHHTRLRPSLSGKSEG